MAIISTYPIDGSVNLTDKLIGTDVEDLSKTKNFTIESILSLKQIGLTNVLAAIDTTNQLPSGLDSILQVKFGAAQGTASDPVMLDALGNITFNQGGLYLFNGYANFERQGSSGGITVTLFRAFLNGSQVGPTKGVELSSTGIMFPYELTLPIQVSAGDVLTWEIMRDSSGINEGGLYIHTNSGPWSNVPSTGINIYKIG